MNRPALLPQLEDRKLRVVLVDGSRLEGESFAARADALGIDDGDRLLVIPWASILTTEVLQDIPRQPRQPRRRR